MNQQEHELAGENRPAPEYGADQIDAQHASVCSRRAGSVVGIQGQARPVWGLAWAATPCVSVAIVSRCANRNRGASLIAALIAWCTANQGPSNEIAEIDLGLLTDDYRSMLPRPGLRFVLKRSSH